MEYVGGIFGHSSFLGIVSLCLLGVRTLDTWSLWSIFAWDFVVSLDGIFHFFFYVHFYLAKVFWRCHHLWDFCYLLDFTFCYLFDVRSLLHLKLVATFFLLRFYYLVECDLLHLLWCSILWSSKAFSIRPYRTFDVVYYVFLMSVV